MLNKVTKLKNRITWKRCNLNFVYDLDVLDDFSSRYGPHYTLLPLIIMINIIYII